MFPSVSFSSKLHVNCYITCTYSVHIHHITGIPNIGREKDLSSDSNISIKFHNSNKERVG